MQRVGQPSRVGWRLTLVFRRHDVSCVFCCVDRIIGLELHGVCTAWAFASVLVLSAMVRLEVELEWPL
eukprot:13565887-Alexandrium_andersonii.AAC.1